MVKLRLLLIPLLLLLASCGTFSRNDGTTSDFNALSAVSDDSVDPIDFAIMNSTVTNESLAVKQTQDALGTPENPEDAMAKDKPVISEKDRIADLNTVFKANELQDYYGIPVMVLRFKTLDEYINISKVDKTKQELDDFLTDGIRLKSYDFGKIAITDQEVELLKGFIAQAQGREKTLIVVYVHKAGIIKWTEDDYVGVRTVYAQAVSTFIYNNLKNVRIEKRFANDVPRDEVFLAMFSFEGSLGANVYNNNLTSSIEWLDTYNKKQKEKIDEEIKRREDLEAIVSNVGGGLASIIDSPKK